MVARSLAGLSLFRAVTDDVRAELSAATVTVAARAGALLYQHGEPATFAWAVWTGRVHLVRTDAHGHRLILEHCGPEEWFGVFAALQGRPYPAAAVAAQDSIVWKLPARVLREVAAREPSVQAGILALASERSDRAQDRLFTAVFEPIEQRLARTMLRLAESVGQVTDSGMVLPIAHQELAETLGTSMETVSRIMSRWHRAGMVSVARERVQILDPDRLERVAAGRDSPDGC